MEHRKHFREERLADMFPESLGHYFAKIFEGTGSPASVHGQWAKPHLQKVAEVVRGFREALNKRGLLTSYEDDLTEVEYPLGELQKYFDGTGSLKDARAARIFGYFIQDRVRKLEQIAIELDEEYQQDLDPGHGSSNAAG